MDNWVLLQVAAFLHRGWRGSQLVRARVDGAARLRLRLEKADRALTLWISTDPRLPWMGSPPPASPRARRTRFPPHPFAVSLERLAGGRRLENVQKALDDRVVTIRWEGDLDLRIRLIPGSAGVDLVGPESPPVTLGRPARGASGRERDVIGADPSVLEGELARCLWLAGEEAGRRDPLRRLGRSLRRLLDPTRIAEPQRLEEELLLRLAGSLQGIVEPVVRLGEPWTGEGPPSWSDDPASPELLPWRPADEAEGAFWQGRHAAETAGWFHHRREEAEARRRRWEAVRKAVERELEKIERRRKAVLGDRARLDAPDAWQRMGEAMLAGLDRAERCAEGWRVPDVHAGEGVRIVEAPPRLDAAGAAAWCFERARKARRAAEAVRRRLDELDARRRRLRQLQRRLGAPPQGPAALEALEACARGEGLPVGLEPTGRGDIGPSRRQRPAPGVRVVTLRDGWEILAGRSARDNDRLTFRVAGPEDTWLHALGYRGAHVVVRHPDRRGDEPPPEVLRQAAAMAAWLSDARREGAVDVHVTRRKYVRKARGAPPGQVILKRSRTLRVRPEKPPGDDA